MFLSHCRTSLQRRRYTAERTLRKKVSWLAIGAVLAAGGGELALAQSRWTPSANNGIAAVQGSLMGTHIAGTIGGVAAPAVFGLPFELAAYGADIGLKNTPPLLSVPGNFGRYPNSAATASAVPFQCVYRFRRAIPQPGTTGGIEAQFGGLFLVPYRPLTNVWADLGAPAVYHPHASIDVRVDNPYLSRKVPEFPEGRHVLQWQAATSMNYVLDVAVPAVLIGAFAYAENQIASKVAAEATKQSAKKWDHIATAASVAFELGLIGVDVSDALSANQWYKDTSVTTAINAAPQTLTVWDVHRPYFRDTQTGATQIAEQNIELEATDFGGVRYSRVAGSLRARFEPVDTCGRLFLTATRAPVPAVLGVGATTVIDWDAREIGGGPYESTLSLAPNQRFEQENIVTTLRQRVTVVDTQAPILVPPPGFARYSAAPVDLTAEPFPLGRPLVVDLADPAPAVTSDAPDVLDVNHRYAIDWRATDASGNSTEPAQQIVTIKAPGTNTAPVAQGASAATLTSQPVEVLLAGVDTDLIDGRVDPLAFEIESYPPNGQFEAPLLPYFIEDFRLSPVGEREDERTLARTSPLGDLAADFAEADPQTHGTFLTNRICNAAAGSANQVAFDNTIPVNFVYEPTYIYVDDNGFYYIRDKFWVCGDSGLQNPDFRPTLSPIPRLSKWNDAGELVAMRPLYRTDSELYEDPWPARIYPTDDFSVDHEGRLWIEVGGFITAGGRLAQFFSFDHNLADQRFHGTFGSNEQQLTSGEWLVGIAGDSRLGLFYELRRNPDCGVFTTCPPDFTQHSLVVRADNADLTAEDNVIGRIAVPGLDDTDATGLAFEYIDVKIDSRGNVYVLDGNANRVHKFSPTVRNDAGIWELGEHIGWLGSCSANLLDSQGVPFNGCDEALGVSRGYACTDETCARTTDTRGADAGAFDAPRSIEIDPNDILYVADTGNSRVQRFGPDGTFAGEAKSTGTGVNQGEDPGFILGNMGEPKQLAVNSSSFYVMEPDPQNGDNFVHVFKTLPFYDVTDATAKIKYVSTFDYQGIDTFTYVVNDGIDRSAPAAVNVSVTRAFRPPERLTSQCFADATLAAEIGCSMPEDGAIVIRMSAYDFDGFLSTGGLDTLTFDVLEQPVHGTLELLSTTDNAAVYRYAPAVNFNGEDALAFDAFDGVAASLEKKSVKLTVVPTPDPVTVEFPANLRAARGFPQVFTASYSDLDADDVSAPSAAAIQWGDGASASAPGWAGSGRRDPNGREIGPQEELGLARGLLIGSHVYAGAGNYTLAIRMQNAPAEGLPDATAAASVEVIEATIVGAELAAPAEAVAPDTVFALQIDVTNHAPQGWAGLTAGDTELELTVPEGLTLVTLDPRCTGTAVVTCGVGDLAPGETTSLGLTARIDLAAARAASVYALQIEIADDGPKVQSKNVAMLTLKVADADGDGAIDADDAFLDDPRYALDTDGDGLPDDWEAAYGFDAAIADDTTADDDGDGFTLAEEFANGSYPLLAERENARPAATLQTGDTTANSFGIAIGGGDLNRDGFVDTVIGAPLDGVGGAAFISYGSTNGASTSLVRIDAPAGVFGFGRSLAVADLDANGYPDIAIGSNNAVSIYVNNGQVLSTPDWVLNGAAAGSDFGRYVAAGDLDGDDAADLVVTDDPVGANGLLSIYLSRRGFGAPVTFTSSSATFGQSAAIADIDGDGVRDLLVGTLGQVHGFLAAHNDWQAASTLTLSFVLSDTGPTTFGYSIASGADIGGDGVDDLVVGKYAGTGQVLVYDSATEYWNAAALGATSTVGPSQTLSGGDDGSLPGDGFGDQLGVRVALGHLDTDAFADLVVGGNRGGLRDSGQIRIYRGSAAGLVAPPQVEVGAADRDMLGYFVAIPGDVNGDGFADVAGGAPAFGTAQNPTPGPGHVRIYEHAFAAVDPAEDPDGDGVRTAVDSCSFAANTDRADLDGDGAGDVCDTDADGDGLSNDADNCPLLASLIQTNSDTDGLGNLCDDDDDNDEVADANDPFPTDGRYTADSDGDGMPDEYENEHGLDPAASADAFADADGDGRNNLDEFLAGSDLDADDVPPTVTAPANVTVSSIGPYTAVMLGAASAVDGKDGQLTAAASATGPFTPGRHVIEWRASDAAGNEGVATQQVDVIPRVDFFGAAQSTGEGATIFVTATLNGAPVSYPVKVPYTLGGTAVESVDYFVSGTFEIASGNAASLALTIASDTAVEGDEIIVVTLGEPTNAVAGNTAEHVVRIVETNLAPFVAIKVAQAGGPRSPVVASDGEVSMTVAIEDPNAGDSHTIDWSETDNALVPSEGFTAESFTFDAAGVAPGVYAVRVRVTDDGGAAATGVRFIRVAATGPVLAADADSDGDGANDAAEGLADTNQNGISDYLEATTDAHLLTAVAGGRRVLQARPGLTLVLGGVALASGSDAAVTFPDITSYGDGGGPAPNADDDAFDYPSGLYDYEVHGLANGGDSAEIVVALPFALPDDASYRKYVAPAGWQSFATDARNTVSSAPGALDACPAPGSVDYVPGLHAGDYCVQLTIEDGGPNDADGAANRVLRDPGGVAVAFTAPAVTVSALSTPNRSVAAGAADIVVLRLRLSSDSPNVAMSSLTLTATGTGNDGTEVRAVELWEDTNGDGAVDAGDALLGSGTYAADNGSLQLQLMTPYALPLGDTDFLVTYDF